MQRSFSAIVLVLPALIALFLWRDLSHSPSRRSMPQQLLLFSAVSLSANILLVWASYFVDLLVMRGRPVSLASVTEYRWIVAQMWCSRMAIPISLITLIMALLSERGRARALCIW